VNIRWREKTNKMQLIRCLLSNFLSHHVSGIIMPIIRRIRPCPTACGVLPWCVDCGWHCVHTAHDAAPQDHSQPQCTHPGRTPHSVGHGLILLMMGIMMPETCWDRNFDNKHRITCILLVLSLHLLTTLFQLPPSYPMPNQRHYCLGEKVKFHPRTGHVGPEGK